MRYTIDHDLHIHSNISSCCKDENQTKYAILNYAKRYKLNTVCVTDHYWDNTVTGASNWYKPQDFNHISKIKPLPTDSEVNFLFGAETECDKNFNLGMPISRFNDFNFVIIPTTHFHMVGFTIPEEIENNPTEKAKIWVNKLEGVLNQNLPFNKIGFAHLCCGLMAKDKAIYGDILKSINETDAERVFSKIAKVGAGVELNSDDFTYPFDEKEAVIRIFEIAKSCGCKFYLGSDSHNVAYFDKSMELLNKAITDLNLTENDKFDYSSLI